MQNPSTIILATMLLVATPLAHAGNDCAASVKLKKSERFAINSPNWTFTFAITTKCAASTGAFEYSYKIMGVSDKPIVKKAPNWTASDKSVFTVVDEQNIGVNVEPEAISILESSIESKKL